MTPTELTMSSADLDERDIRAVVEVLESGRLALGPKCEAFEQALAHRAGVAHGIGVSSGTAALHVIVRSLGIGPGDEVILPSFTFAATANSLLFEGATPVFADIERDTFNLDPADVERRITERTRAIAVVDVFGHPAEWDALTAIAERHGLAVIADSCEAIGATYRGRPIGSFGDAATFAFYPNKQITTGEGGMIVTDDDAIAEAARSLRNQGRPAMGAWLTHERLGYNYRLDEMSAALGVSQVARLDEILAKRKRVADGYAERLAAIDGLRGPQVRDHVEPSWFVYVVLLEPGLDRDAVMRQLDEAGVPTRAYFDPLHLQPYLKDRIDVPGGLPVTESVAARTIALPFHNHLIDAQLDRVAETLGVAVEAAHAQN